LDLGPLLAIFFIFAGISTLWAAPAGPLPAEDRLSFNIRYYDKRIYYLEQDPIFVLITLTNDGSAPFRFKLADERVFSIDFDVRSLANQSLEPADYLLRKRSESRNVYFREIIVEPGESFSFVEDIRNYAALRDAGSFVVQARIFPELFRETAVSSPRGAPLVSNRLNLNLRPPALPGSDDIPFQLDAETGAVLVRDKLPPDEVITYMLTARQKSQWEKFFLYLDLEALITNDAVRRRSWLNEPEEGRLRMMAKYREDLKNSMADEDIALIPSNFRIENTSHNGETASVVVTEWFTVGRIIERRRYTYNLRRRDDIWTIQDYTVTRLGTE
jgi:hypothetical protein